MISRTGARERFTGMVHSLIDSPLGPLLAVGRDGALTQLHLDPAAPPSGSEREDGAFASLAAELEEYFAGRRRAFSTPLAPAGTPFEHRVWDALREVPYGTTVTYGEIARRIGAAGSARAVGFANGRNPIAIIVPCHRVIGASGALTGYAGGVSRKRSLLDLEAGVTPLLP